MEEIIEQMMERLVGDKGAGQKEMMEEMRAL
jgi:hypothetical protein